MRKSRKVFQIIVGALLVLGASGPLFADAYVTNVPARQRPTVTPSFCCGDVRVSLNFHKAPFLLVLIPHHECHVLSNALEVFGRIAFTR